jgi:hypothetical protein
LLLKAYVDGNSKSVFYDFVTIDNNGKVVAQKIVEKKFSTQTSYSGNYIWNVEDKILLLGNEGRDGSQTFQATYFDYKGNVSSQKQLEMTNPKYYFVPRTAHKVSDKAIIVGAAPYDANGYTPTHMYGVVRIN